MKKTLFKILIILAALLLTIPVLCSCDPTFIDVFTELKTDYSGSRTVEIAVKTEYIQKGSVMLSDNKSLFDGILNMLPEGEVGTFEEEGYTRFTSRIDFEDVNFLQHISIDDFAENPPARFYARMEKVDYFFYSEFFFDDYVDMKIDETLLSSGDAGSDYNRMHDLASADDEILVITYQIKCPVKIIDSNADLIGEDNIAIWNIKYGDQRNISMHGKKTKFLSYFLVIALGLIGLFVIFIIFALMFSSRRKRSGDTVKKPYYTYDNYFKRDKYFSSDEDEGP